MLFDDKSSEIPKDDTSAGVYVIITTYKIMCYLMYQHA